MINMMSEDVRTSSTIENFSVCSFDFLNPPHADMSERHLIRKNTRKIGGKSRKPITLGFLPAQMKVSPRLKFASVPDSLKFRISFFADAGTFFLSSNR